MKRYRKYLFKVHREYTKDAKQKEQKKRGIQLYLSLTPSRTNQQNPL